jgi:hypothetical protein
MIASLGQTTEPVALQAPSAGEVVMGVLSQSAGSFLLDLGIGAGVGYLIAPKDQKLGYAAGVGAATGIAGVFGLLGGVGYRYLLGKK